MDSTDANVLLRRIGHRRWLPERWVGMIMSSITLRDEHSTLQLSLATFDTGDDDVYLVAEASTKGFVGRNASVGVSRRTEGNLAIPVRFTDGASEKERALAPWGRRLLFVRTADGGDLEPEAEVTPAQPTTHPRNDEGR